MISRIQKAKRGRRIAWVGGVGVLAVVALLALEWERIYDLYYAYRTGYEFVWMPEGVVPGEFGQLHLSNSGKIAVTRTNSAADSQAGSWSAAERSVRLLGTLPGCDPHSIACAMNENGDIVGSVPGHAFLWTAEKGMEELRSAGAKCFFPMGINKRRQVVGCLGSEVTCKACLWDPASGLRELPGLDELGEGRADGINEGGWIVGISRACTRTNETWHPVVWTPDLKILDLGLRPGSWIGFTHGINDRGEVLVSFSEGPFLWTEEAGYYALPRPFGNGTHVYARNNRGEVLLVNTMRDSPPGAFLLSGGALKDLPPPPRIGSAIYTYTGLNDRGWLIGYVQMKGENERDPASRRGFLARPVK